MHQGKNYVPEPKGNRKKKLLVIRALILNPGNPERVSKRDFDHTSS